MVDAMAVPVSIKCRLGVDEMEDYDVFLAFVDTVARAGCAYFVVHARKAWLSGLSPKENREIPPLRHEWVHRLKRDRSALRVVLNGGLADVEATLAHVGAVDGVMLGRAAYHEPFRLHELDVRLFGGVLASREALLQRFVPYMEAQLARGVALKHLTRHVLGLFHAQPGGRAFRQVLSEGAHRPGAGLEVVEQALAATRERALAA
jgi:tRNA-dihydrouridine synthase A